MKPTGKWRPLHEAFEYVLKQEQSVSLTERRLRRVLGKRQKGAQQVRCRAGCTIDRNDEERSNVLLPGDFFMYASSNDALSGNVSVARVRWNEDEATLPPTHPFAPFAAYRLEVAWQDLIALWPEQRREKTIRRRGRKPTYDAQAILNAAHSDIDEHGRPATLEKFYHRMEERLAGDSPGRTYLMALLKSVLEKSAN
jgi:hypothetical protein